MIELLQKFPVLIKKGYKLLFDAYQTSENLCRIVYKHFIYLKCYL